MNADRGIDYAESEVQFIGRLIQLRQMAPTEYLLLLLKPQTNNAYLIFTATFEAVYKKQARLHTVHDHRINSEHNKQPNSNDHSSILSTFNMESKIRTKIFIHSTKPVDRPCP